MIFLNCQTFLFSNTYAPLLLVFNIFYIRKIIYFIVLYIMDKQNQKNSLFLVYSPLHEAAHENGTKTRCA